LFFTGIIVATLELGIKVQFPSPKKKVKKLKVPHGVTFELNVAKVVVENNT
jgi:hypothetical protein